MGPVDRHTSGFAVYKQRDFNWQENRLPVVFSFPLIPNE